MVVVLLTISRFPLFSYNIMPREVMTVVYNCGASVIVCISALVPIRLLKSNFARSLKKKSSVNILRQNKSPVGSQILAFTSRNNSTLISVLLIALAHVLLLGISAGLYFASVSNNILGILLTCWRCIFCFNVFREVRTLIQCLGLFQGTTLGREYYQYMATTLYLRIGICLTLVFKFLNIRNKEMSLVHMILLTSSLLMFHKKALLMMIGKHEAPVKAIDMRSSANAHSKASNRSYILSSSPYNISTGHRRTGPKRGFQRNRRARAKVHVEFGNLAEEKQCELLDECQSPKSSVGAEYARQYAVNA
uniref:Uncharacterized protein n=1 Tax=Fibrocapsa japonica TaxID=94617 RepID=A0A7S2XZ90_9STRA